MEELENIDNLTMFEDFKPYFINQECKVKRKINGLVNFNYLNLCIELVNYYGRIKLWSEWDGYDSLDWGISPTQECVKGY